MPKEQEAQTSGPAVEPRSVRGTIRLPESDPDLENGSEEVRELFRRSVDRTEKEMILDQLAVEAQDMGFYD